MTPADLDSPDQVRRESAGVIAVDLWYPGIDDHATVIEIGLMHVRAADEIRVSYDFDRDGWTIAQDQDATEHGTRSDWQEVAFVRAWEKIGKRPDPVAEAVRAAVEAEREACAARLETLAADTAALVPVEGTAALVWGAAQIRERGKGGAS